jgi:acyl-CoA reductase-like NAD-dependent aldehyde dehydrogenase
MDPMPATVCASPATREILGESSEDTVDSVREIIGRARRAQGAWAETPIRQRSRAILRARDYLVAHADELSEIISQDNGKTRVDAISTEVLPAALAASYYARKAPQFLRRQRLGAASLLMANKRSQVRRVPWGVVAVISPWNYPLSIPFSEVVMGLLAGNAVVLKVATQTQLVGRAIARCFAAAGLPEGVFAYVNLPGRLAGDALFEGGVNKLFFTGSVAVGKQLMAKAAETLTPICLELGGNDAMLVCADADLQRAASGAVWGGFSNCGQSCAGVERIYVHADVYDAFLDLLSKKITALRVGRDVDFAVDLGAMTTEAQSAKVRQHVQDAVDRGAVIHAQSACPPESAGNFLPAMVLTGVDHSMLLMREETFGPVVGVMKVASMDEAIALANDSAYGLTGSVWSRHTGTARRLAERIEAGTVMINDHLISHGLAETPWGGFKQSSLGRTHGAIGFAEMTQPQCIITDVMPGLRRNLWWHPHGRQVYDTMTSILRMLYAPRWSTRVAACWRVVKSFPRVFRP